MKEAHEHGEIATVYELARKLGGRRRGPKKRKLGILPQDEPRTEEWVEYMKKKGEDGGYEADEIEKEEHRWAYEEGMEEIGEGWDWAERARKDTEGVEKAIRRGKNRRATR